MSAPAGDPTADATASARVVPLLGLAASVVAIGAVGLLICCAIAVLALLVLVSEVGRDGAADFIQRLEFDIPLKTRVGAAAVGALYVGLAIATISAAGIAARRRWPARLALLRPRRIGWEAIVVAALTLFYGAAATFVMTRLGDHRFVASGPTDVLLLIIAMVNLTLLAPFAEEMLFRGWLYTGLRTRLGVLPSFLVTAAAFAAIHWSSRRILMVLPLALALGLVREFTGSIRPTIGLHLAYNLVSILITLAEF